jgi:hypothetical protein
MRHGDAFSYEGLGALFEYLTEYEEDTGAELELDVVAICCDFDEYASAMGCISDCGYGFEPDLDVLDEDMDQDEREEAIEEQALEWLRDHTTAIEFDGGIIIQQF